MHSGTVIEDIDQSHLKANQALQNKEFASYMNIFSDDLIYKQMSGKSINKGQLSNDTHKYFARIISYSNNYERIHFSMENDFFIEKLVQKATVTIRVFLFFSKKFKVEREGIYKWKKVDNVWKIAEVEIVNEKII